jgi:hypothetical protein
MKGDTTNILRQHNKALDRGMAGVMPDHWEGHGRLLIRDDENDLSPEQEEKAIEHLENLARKKPQHFDKYGAEKVANRVIAKLTE